MSDVIRRTIADLTLLGETLDRTDRERIREIIAGLRLLEQQHDQFTHIGLFDSDLCSS